MTNTRGVLSNSIVCESFLQSNAPDILTLSNLEDSINSSKFPVRDYLPLIRKDSLTQIYGLAVYMKVELPFPWKSYVGKWLTLLYSASYFIFHSSYRPALLIFLSLKFLIALHWLTFHWRFVRTLLSLFSLFTLQTQTRMLLLIEQYLMILLLIRIAFVIIYEVFHGRFNAGASAAAADFW